MSKQFYVVMAIYDWTGPVRDGEPDCYLMAFTDREKAEAWAKDKRLVAVQLVSPVLTAVGLEVQ